MKKLFTLLTMFSILGFINAADLPLDFESGTYDITDFDGGALTIIDNPHADGINTSAKVAQMIKGAGQTWAGSYITLDNPIDFSAGKTMKMKVYSPRVGAQFLLKVENLTDGNIWFEKTVSTTVANEWEELTYDYSAINTDNSYQKVVLIVDNGTAGDGSANFTFLMDDIQLVDDGSTSTASVLPIDFESASVDYAFLGFDGGEVTVVDNPSATGINSSSKVGKMVKGAGQTWAGAYVVLDQPIDFSNSTTLKMKVYSPKIDAAVLLKVEDGSDNTKNYEKTVNTTVANEWEELIFDMTGIDLSYTYQNVVLIFENGTMGDGSANFTYYFDDIMVDGGSESVLPTLPLDFESATTDYTFTDFDGGSMAVIDNPQASGINTSAKVAQMVKNAGQTWAGAYITLADPIDFSAGKTFKMKVYSPRTDAKFLLKVENLTDGGIWFEKEVTATVTNQWEELSFDYSEINTDNTYQKIVLIMDNGTMGDGSADFTFLIDDIRLTNATAIQKTEKTAVNLYSHDGSIYINSEHMITPAILNIYDLSGKLILNKTLNQPGEIIPFTQKGVFVVQLSDNNKLQIAIKKLVIN